MTLQIVKCDSCWYEASNQCGGNASATRREWRALRFGCLDAVKATKGREMTHGLGTDRE